MFHSSEETQEALSENKPGAHAMHRLHNLVHHAEHTAAMPVGDEDARNQYVVSLLKEIASLADRASKEILKQQAVPPAPEDRRHKCFVGMPIGAPPIP